MTKVSKMTKCVLHSIGLQILVHPTEHDKLIPGYTFGGTDGVPFSSSRLSYRGRIRIPTSGELNKSLLGASIASRSYKAKRIIDEFVVCIVDSILNDIVCYNTTLESLLTSENPIIEDSPKPFEIDFTESNTFVNLTDKLASIFNDDFYWSLNMPRDGGFVYYSAFAILVVSNRDVVIKAIQNQDFSQMRSEQVVSLRELSKTGSAVIDFLRPMKNLQFQYANIKMEFPITLIVIEDQEVFQWLDGKKTSKPDVAMLQQAKQDLRNFLRSSRMKIVEWQIDWASSRLSELLVSQPERNLEGAEKRQKRLEEIYVALDEIIFFRDLYLLVKVFIEREESNFSEDDEKLFLNSVSPTIENKKKMHNLDEKLSEMKDAFQAKEKLEKTIIENQKVEQRHNIETYFSRLSMLLGVFVVFEVLATFFAWLLPQGDLVGIFSFIAMIFAIVGLWWFILSKAQFVAENDTSAQEKQANSSIE